MYTVINRMARCVVCGERSEYITVTQPRNLHDAETFHACSDHIRQVETTARVMESKHAR
jgi:predicted RNA-binding protein with PUA domain